MNLSNAICNSKNEDIFFSCYLSFFFLHFCCHTIEHSPIFICQLPIYINTVYIIYIKLYNILLPLLYAYLNNNSKPNNAP